MNFTVWLIPKSALVQHVIQALELGLHLHVGGLTPARGQQSFICTALGLFIHGPANAGIGSLVHHMGQALALAIESNRTLVVAPDPTFIYTEAER